MTWPKKIPAGQSRRKPTNVADLASELVQIHVFDGQLKNLSNVKGTNVVTTEMLKDYAANGSKSASTAINYLKRRKMSEFDLSAATRAYAVGLNYLRGKFPSTEELDDLIKKNVQWSVRHAGLIGRVWSIPGVADANGIGMPSYLMMSIWAVGVLGYIKKQIEGSAVPLPPDIRSHLLFKLTGEGKPLSQAEAAPT